MTFLKIVNIFWSRFNTFYVWIQYKKIYRKRKIPIPISCQRSLVFWKRFNKECWVDETHGLWYTPFIYLCAVMSERIWVIDALFMRESQDSSLNAWSTRLCLRMTQAIIRCVYCNTLWRHCTEIDKRSIEEICGGILTLWQNDNFFETVKMFWSGFYTPIKLMTGMN